MSIIKCLSFSGVVLACVATQVTAEVSFQDIGVSSGLSGNQCSWSAAWGDYDNDGDLDLYATTHAQSVLLSEFGIVQQSKLYKNNGNLTFSDVTVAAGIKEDNADPHSAAWIDFDNDGDKDLFVHHGTEKIDPSETESYDNYNELYLNNGNGTFQNIAQTAGVLGVNYRGRGSAWADFDRDGDLDFYGPGEYSQAKGGGGSLLYRNNADLTFTNISSEAGVERAGVSSFEAGWMDYDKDGWQDLYVSSSFAPVSVSFYKNNKNATFTDVTEETGLSGVVAGRTVAPGDYDNDGDLDLYILSDDATYGGRLFENDGRGHFTDITVKSGALFNASGRAGIWGDYDNDGDLDLYLVAVYHTALKPGEASHLNMLYRNNGNGTFSDVTAKAGVYGHPTGGGSDASFLDVNNDGSLDIFLTHGMGVCPEMMGPYMIYLSSGAEGNWLKIKLEGAKSNRDGLGAQVSVRAGGKSQKRIHTGPLHYLSQDNQPLHFGLGVAKQARIEVRWPNGKISAPIDVTANQTISIKE